MQKGNIYGAVNFLNRIVRISVDGSNLTELTTGSPLDFPTSLAFGTGTEKSTLFISNFSVIHFLSDPPMPADAKPGIIALRVEP